MQVVMNRIRGAGVQQECLTETRVIGKDFGRDAVSLELAHLGLFRENLQLGREEELRGDRLRRRGSQRLFCPFGA